MLAPNRPRRCPPRVGHFTRAALAQPVHGFDKSPRQQRNVEDGAPVLAFIGVQQIEQQRRQAVVVQHGGHEAVARAAVAAAAAVGKHDQADGVRGPDQFTRQAVRPDLQGIVTHQSGHRILIQTVAEGPL